jgi:hypothetical protein
MFVRACDHHAFAAGMVFALRLGCKVPGNGDKQPPYAVLLSDTVVIDDAGGMCCVLCAVLCSHTNSTPAHTGEAQVQ